MHYYNFHIGDYKAHTHHLNLIEDIAYRRLLDLYYMTEKPIVAESAARLICMREYGHEVLCVLMEFFDETEDGFVSKRADKEIASFRAMSEGGKRGAEKRWNKGANGVAIATASPGYSHPTDTLIATNNQEPITNNQIDSADKKPSAISIGTWLSSLNDEKAIPENDPIFDYADGCGISNDMLALCWYEFKARHSNGKKRYKDWRQAFRNAVRDNYYRIWAFDSDGKAYLTSQGRQAANAHREAA